MEQKIKKVETADNHNQLAPIADNLSLSERFALGVIKDVMGTNVHIPEKQRRLLQTYYIALDAILKEAENKRSIAPTRASEPTIVWKNVNMVALSQKAMAFSQIGLTPALPNHINMIPFLNKKTQKYDIGFIEGYKGLEIKAKKYGLDYPNDITIETVYSNDTNGKGIIAIKKSFNNPTESYEFSIDNPFDRGEIIGGFIYFGYEKPEKNKLILMTMKDIEKRKPSYASPEFWGGEKAKWKDGKVVGHEKVEGWLDEMVRKTLERHAYNSITLDGDKLDEAYTTAMSKDSVIEAVEKEISDNANKETVDVESEIINDSNKQHELAFKNDVPSGKANIEFDD